MSIEGMPDPEKHRICRRCGKWFDPEQGSLVAPESRFERNYLLGTGHLLRFQCHRCTRIRRATQTAIWGTLVALLTVPWLLRTLHIIE